MTKNAPLFKNPWLANPWIANPWMGVVMDSWALAMEAATVVTLRSMKIAMNGPGAGAEMQRMVNEKVATVIDLQTRAMTGRLGDTPHDAAAKTVALYRSKVNANVTRLKTQK